MPPPRSLRRRLVLGLLFVALAGADGLARMQVTDVAVKAEFVVRFPEFVHWPDETMADGEGPQLCLSPAHPFGDRLEQLSSGRTARGRPVSVRALRRQDSAAGCQLLYVAADDLDMLHRARPLPVLTVGDKPDFLERGGIIQFRVVGGRVRFEIHLGHARDAGLRMDSQRLALASVVHGRPR